MLLCPICTLNTYLPQEGDEGKAKARKKCQIDSINAALSLWCEPNGCVMLVSKVLEENDEFQKSMRKRKKAKPVSQEAVNLRLCRNKMRNGLYTTAIRTLNSSGVAPHCASTLNELRNKHPSTAPPLIPSEPIVQEAFSASKELVLGLLKSFPKGTSCGRDVLRAQHLLDALSGAAAAISDELISVFTDVVNLLLAGKCPSVLGIYISSAPLTPLMKPWGGLRPIFVGTIWRRLVSKVATTHIGKVMHPYLFDYQFGVGVSG